VTLCTAVVGYQHFRSPCCLDLRVETAGVGESGIDMGPDWRGVAGAASQ